VLAITARTPNWLAPILTWLGLISYPLYALHMPMIHIFSGALLPDVVPHQIKALGWSGVMVLTMLLSWPVAALYEPKARGWLEGVWRRKPRAPWVGAAKA